MKNLVPAESFFTACMPPDNNVCCHLHHSSEELRLLQDGVVPESSSVVPRRWSSSARLPHSPVRRECRRGAGLPWLRLPHPPGRPEWQRGAGALQRRDFPRWREERSGSCSGAARRLVGAPGERRLNLRLQRPA
jgi:hypothetical protein